ncbi:hypothetical protein C8F01DRAFT_1187266 [Mycena amicta]|nr:hypothetical protein C8F01DRAFT_1187266 [Mycena amicta]
MPRKKKFRFTPKRKQKPVVADWDFLDVLTYANGSQAEDHTEGAESEAEDLEFVQGVKDSIGLSLSANQLEALGSYSSRHRTVAWTGVRGESRQLGILLRKLRKSNAVLTEGDYFVIDATAPTEPLVESAYTAAATSAPTYAARRASLSVRDYPALTPASTAEADVYRAISVAGSHPGNARLFLRLLNGLANETRGDCWIIGDSLAYRDATHKKSKTYSNAAFQVFGTLSAFTLPDVRRQYTIALFAFPCKANLLGMTKAQIAAVEWHSNAAVMIDHPHGLGRDLVIFEPNITGVEARETCSRRIFQPWMGSLLKAEEIRPRYARLWVNDKRRARNNNGTCLRLTLEWMVEVVKQGLVVRRAENGDTQSIKGFRRVLL